jgi:hypothetical protein
MWTFWPNSRSRPRVAPKSCFVNVGRDTCFTWNLLSRRFLAKAAQFLSNSLKIVLLARISFGCLFQTKQVVLATTLARFGSGRSHAQGEGEGQNPTQANFGRDIWVTHWSAGNIYCSQYSLESRYRRSFATAYLAYANWYVKMMKNSSKIPQNQCNPKFLKNNIF